MTLEDLIAAGGLIDIRCMDCHTRTQVDPAFFLARRGNITLAELRRHTGCPACGASEVALVPIDPTQVRR